MTKCLHCNEEIGPETTSTLYCTPAHRKQFNKKQARKRKNLKLDPAQLQHSFCPTPLKRAYRTMGEAWIFIAAVHYDSPNMNPYLCPCGGIHIGRDSRKTYENPMEDSPLVEEVRRLYPHHDYPPKEEA